MEEAFNASRLNGQTFGDDVCARNPETGEYWPAAGHYVVWRNYTTDIWIRVAALEADAPAVVRGQRMAREHTLNDAKATLTGVLTKETLECLYGVNVARYNPITFTFSADEKSRLNLGIEAGSSDSIGSVIDEELFKDFNEKLKKFGEDHKSEEARKDQRVERAAYEPSTAAQAAEKKARQEREAAQARSRAADSHSAKDGDSNSSESSDSVSDKGGSKSASPSSSGDGVLPPAAPAWVSHVAQMILRAYGLEQYAQFGALALMMLAPDLMEELAAFSAELSAGLDNDDLNAVMKAINEAYKIGAMANSLFSSIENVAGEETFGEALTTAVTEIRDMPPELRKELSEELGEDFENIAKVTSALSADNVEAISGVFSEEATTEILWDEVTKLAEDKIEEVVVEAAIEKFQEETGLTMSPDVAAALYRGETDNVALALGKELLTQVAENAGLSAGDVDEILDGNIRSVGERKARQIVEAEISNALQSAGLDPAIASLSLSLAAESDPADALLDAAISALPPDYRAAAVALANGDAEGGLVASAKASVGNSIPDAARDAFFDDGDLVAAAEHIVTSQIKQLASAANVQVPDDLTVEDLGTLPSAALRVLAGHDGPISKAAYHLLSGGSLTAEHLNALKDFGTAELTNSIAERSHELDKLTVKLAKRLIESGPQTKQVELAGLAKKLKRVQSLDTLMVIGGSPKNREQLEWLYQREGQAGWQGEYWNALKTGDRNALRGATMKGASEQGLISDLVKDIGQSEIVDAMEEHPVVRDLLGSDTGEIVAALADGATDPLRMALNARIGVLAEVVDDIGDPETVTRKIGDAASQAMSGAVAQQFMGPEIFAVVSSDDPLAVVTKLSANKIDERGAELLRKIVDDGPAALVASYSNDLSTHLGQTAYAFLIVQSDTRGIAATLVRDALETAFGDELEHIAPDVFAQTPDLASAITALDDTLRSALVTTIEPASPDAAVILATWNLAALSSIEANVGSWVVNNDPTSVIDWERALIDVLEGLVRADLSDPDRIKLQQALRFDAAVEIILTNPIATSNNANTTIAALSDTILQGDVGAALAVARTVRDFSSELVKHMSSAALKESGALEEIDGLGVDPLDLITSPDALDQLITGLQDNAEQEIQKIQEQADSFASDVLSVVTASKPVAVAVSALPDHLQPLARAIIGGTALEGPLKSIATHELTPHIGAALSDKIVNGDLLEQLRASTTDQESLVQIAIGILTDVDPTISDLGVVSLETVLSTATDSKGAAVLAGMFDKASQSQTMVLETLLSQAVSPNDANLRRLRAAVENHIDIGLQDAGVQQVLASVEVLQQIARANLPVEEVDALSPLLTAKTINSFQSEVDRLNAEEMRKLSAALDGHPGALITLQLSTQNRISATPSVSKDAALTNVLAIALDLAAAALENERTAKLIFGDSIGSELEIIAQLVRSGGNLSDHMPSVAAAANQTAHRAQLAVNSAAWREITPVLRSQEISTELSEAIQTAATQGKPVPAQLEENATKALKSAGLGDKMVEALVQGKPNSINHLAFAKLSSELARPSVNADAENATAALMEYLGPVVDLTRSENPSLARAFDNALARSNCAPQSTCEKDALLLLGTALSDEEAMEWIHGDADVRNRVSKSALDRIFCGDLPNDIVCDFRDAGDGQRVLILDTTSDTLGNSRRSRQLLNNEFEPLAQSFEGQVVETATGELRAAVSNLGVQNLDGVDSINELVSGLTDNSKGLEQAVENGVEFPGTPEAKGVKSQAQKLHIQRSKRMDYYIERSRLIKKCLELGLGDEALCTACTADPEVINGKGIKENEQCSVVNSQ
ncbi:hypothetical protein RKLH11_1194 [Rhodobacteraceae bacterium KLH11]|nr:hypothetical protein RKLH11_1194 [Rhodobacteraceae bacterium KLH11]